MIRTRFGDWRASITKHMYDAERASTAIPWTRSDVMLPAAVEPAAAPFHERIASAAVSPFVTIGRTEHVPYRALVAIGVAIVVPLFLVFGNHWLWSYNLVAAYFAAMWAVLFYLLYREHGASFLTGSILFVIVLGIAVLYLFVLDQTGWMGGRKDWLDSLHGIRFWLGTSASIGAIEETLKALPIVALFALTGGSVISLRMLLFYGLVAGLGFGVYECVQYQEADVNTLNQLINPDIPPTTTMIVDAPKLTGFFLNCLAYATTDPLLHATFTSIFVFFIWLSVGVPCYAVRCLTLLAGFVIAVVLHGAYDGFQMHGEQVAALIVAVITIAFLSICVVIADVLQVRRFSGQPKTNSPTWRNDGPHLEPGDPVETPSPQGQ